MKESKFYKNNQCLACAHHCKIQENKTGICGVRTNINNKIYELVYGKVAAMNIDPIEKKPLYHFLPNTKVLTFGTFGCNFKCLNCQNSEISQFVDLNYLGKDTEPKEIINLAIKNKIPSIAYSYNEPTVFVDFAIDTMKLAKKHKLNNIFVSNGYQSEESFKEIIKYLDAINIDLKTFNKQTHQNLCKAKLDVVLTNIEKFHKKTHLEITTLLIPNINDSDKELNDIANFISNISKDIPWHISAFHPSYKLDEPPTPLNLLKKAKTIGEKYLNYVYLGNVPADINTYCPDCKTLVVDRTNNKLLIKNNCPKCKKEIYGKWK